MVIVSFDENRAASFAASSWRTEAARTIWRSIRGLRGSRPGLGETWGESTLIHVKSFRPKFERDRANIPTPPRLLHIFITFNYKEDRLGETQSGHLQTRYNSTSVRLCQLVIISTTGPPPLWTLCDLFEMDFLFFFLAAMVSIHIILPEETRTP